jgi:acylphosphatase
MNKKQKVHVFFTGHVQGVGFRFTARKIAEKLGLAGFVQNLPDGRVEIVCEGDKSVLDDFLSEIEEAMRGYISNSTIEWDDMKGGFSAFEIRF